jgi:hypothetical protein
VWSAGALAVLLLAAAAALRGAGWNTLYASIVMSGQSYAAQRMDATGASAAQAFAFLGLLAAGLTLAAAAGLALWTRREPRAALLLAALAVAELFVFSRMQRPTFDSAVIAVPQLREFLAAQPGDYRILNLNYHNGGVWIGARDAWGYDPAVARRYAELVSWSAGNDPDLTTQYVQFRRFHPLLAMLRVKYVVEVKDNVMTITPRPAPLRQVELIGAYQVRAGREAILRALDAPSFDPRKEVILEREPQPAPVVVASQGHAEVVRQGTDYLEIDADVGAPSVLLVTDAWTPAWRARSLSGSSASDYEVVPANYAMRAVALGPGKHRLRMEYSPASFHIGLAVSLLACAAWIGALLVLRRRERMKRRA